MAKETITVQCYPDDALINKKIKQYEAFGWELIGNQHCQEYEGQTKSYDVIDKSTTITSHYSSFNKLTFTREKSAAWYQDVVELENKYNRLMNKKPIEPSNKKAPVGLFILPVLLTIIGIYLIISGVATYELTALVVIGIVSIVSAVIVLIVAIVKNSLYSSANEEYNKLLSDWKKTSLVEAEKIAARAERMING